MGEVHLKTQGNFPLTNKMRTVLAALLIPLIAATAFGGIALWPEDRKHATPDAIGQQTQLVNATIDEVRDKECVNDPSGTTCTEAQVIITSGPDDGRTIVMEIAQGPGQPVLNDGDKIVVGRLADPTGRVDYIFSDFQRNVPLAWMALAFAVLVVAVARWRGIGAIIGLLITWLVITQFMLPSILEGNSPILVALVGSAAIVLLALYISHGLHAYTTVALIGTLISLVITGVLAMIAVDAAHLTGLAAEESTYVQSYAGSVDIKGLILGGVVLGALGVLNDMTVTQSSSVREIHLAQPNLSKRQLYTSGMRVGRDHIASTVYTLVLAYTGAALPLLILFTIANRSFGDVVGGELVAEEVVRTLAGSVGLILSVPITTALAALVEKSRLTQADIDATPPPPPAEVPKPPRRRLFRRKQEFTRRMGRRERKFWENG